VFLNGFMWCASSLLDGEMGFFALIQQQVRQKFAHATKTLNHVVQGPKVSSGALRASCTAR
jgi:hypothetical protein